MTPLNTGLMFSKASDNWSTPQDFFDALDAEFHFDIDVAASRENTKNKRAYYDAEQDALKQSWRGAFAAPPVCWMNPPYSKCREFMAKAAEEAVKGCTVVALVPSRTDTQWWHRYIWAASHHLPYPGVQIRFIRGRLKFGDGKNSAPFPSVVVIFRRPVLL